LPGGEPAYDVSMSGRGIERAAYAGSAVFAGIVVAVMLVAPLEVIWTAAIIFGIALLALIAEAFLVRGLRRTRRSPG
jgi:hypothetical protein